MATNKKNAFTNATAMNAVNAILSHLADEQVAEFASIESDNVQDLRDKVAHMTETAQPKAREKRESAATKANKILAVKAIEAILNAQKPVDWKYLAEHVTGMTSSQKAVEVMKHALATEKVERVQIKGKVYYQQAGISDTEENAA